MTRLTLLPAVDVTDGHAVQLVQGVAGSGGQYGDPMEAALAWQRAGASWIHLVDLDAAFGRGSNAGLLADVVHKVDVQVEMSGGIRDDDSLARALGTGCARYVVTDVLKDGTLRGPNLDLLRNVCGRTTAPVVASGGVSSLTDLRAIASLVPLGVEGAIIGTALYEGAFTLTEALAEVSGPK